MPSLHDTPALDMGQPRMTAHEFVLNTLRRSILGGTLPGGSRLVQADIASKLSVSTTPVREALRDLTAEGLVVFRPHIGAVVRGLDLDEVIELYEIRKALEPVAMRRAAARITPDEIAAGQELIKEMGAETDPASWAELNHRFHALLEDAAGAPILRSILKSVQDVAAMYVAHSLIIQPSRITSGNKEHRALLAALRRHDGEAAAEVLLAHLDSTLRAIIKTQSGAGAVSPSADGVRNQEGGPPRSTPASRRPAGFRA